ncbi:hypothetical protein [Thermostaphylospora chromogena]|jgi:hypothetical protein|uniref:Uncharacterized protein n=1 Tax=Thermostaphylospora chromogena TaxID=35622 RepID=A0A1H1CY43_9ACTN|nr:hypothetical protein [Thermostaphylospora chromogena]SDQ68486.1 hypothetical protein SAMN04489764_1683 [Thermostaphylospora chromogena]
MADCTCIWKNGVRLHACTLHAGVLPSGLHIEAAWSTRHDDEPKGCRR